MEGKQTNKQKSGKAKLGRKDFAIKTFHLFVRK